MIDRNKDFQNLCNKLIYVYKETFNKEISVEDIIEHDKFKSIYRELAKAHHADKGTNGKEMTELNVLRDKLKVCLDDPDFISSFMLKTRKIDFDLDKYRLYVIDRLKAKKDDYNEIWAEFEDEVKEFENLILFEKTKAGITKLYYGFVKELEVKLKKSRYVRHRKIELQGFVDDRNKENVHLFNEFKNKIERCYDINEVAELYEQYQVILKKNSFAFVLNDSLSRLCGKYQDEELNHLISEATNKVRLIDFSRGSECRDEFMKIYVFYSNKISVKMYNLECYEKLSDLMKSGVNANYDGINIDEVLKCSSIDSANIVFKSLKESINSRIDFSKRVYAKISGFRNRCKQNPDNSFTEKFIFDKLKSLYSYYDPMDKNLSKLEMMLAIIEKEIDNQREIDQEKASNKKDMLRHKFNQDFNEGIFLKNGQQFLDYNLEQISKFGGFADFENKTVRMELPRIVSDVYNYLVDIEERVKKEKNIKDKKTRLRLIKDALNFCLIFAKNCRDIKDCNRIKINDNVVVDYRTFSKLVQSFKNIDYLNCSIDELVNMISFFNDVLYGEELDNELENIVNKKR